MKKLFCALTAALLIPFFSYTAFALELNPLNWFDKNPKDKVEEKKPEQKDIKGPQKAEPAKEPQEILKKDTQPQPAKVQETRSPSPDVKTTDKPVQTPPEPEKSGQIKQSQQPAQKVDTGTAVVPAQAAVEPETSRKFINSLDAGSPQAAAVLKDVVDVMYCGKIVEEIPLDELKKSIVEGPFYGYLMARSIGDKAVYKDIVGIFKKLNCESTYKNSLEMYLMNQKTGRVK
ncbi:MAG: hypothetical protein EPN22_08115 [Nitrospirae bacterium]|nr:MAG: hypothetical protein EPN22_08115 [Nitrospirota bacterium]